MPAPDWTRDALDLDTLDVVVAPPVDPASPIGARFDPTAWPVKFAILSGAPPRTKPADADWKDGAWRIENAALPGGQPTYIAGPTVGPGGDFPLDVGTYYVWINVDTGDIRPVCFVGVLRIT